MNNELINVINKKQRKAMNSNYFINANMLFIWLNITTVLIYKYFINTDILIRLSVYPFRFFSSYYIIPSINIFYFETYIYKYIFINFPLDKVLLPSILSYHHHLLYLISQMGLSTSKIYSLYNTLQCLHPISNYQNDFFTLYP
jgi:hypothetical protein